MKEKLKKLFEFQKFEKNQEIEKMTMESQDFLSLHYLNDDVLSLVAGAGENKQTEEDNIGKK